MPRYAMAAHSRGLIGFTRDIRAGAPRGTSRDTIRKLNAAAVEILADPAVQPQLIDLGLEIFPRKQQTPEALSAMQKADAEKWWPIIKELGIRAQ